MPSTEKRSMKQRFKDAFKDLGSPPTQRYDQQSARKTKPDYNDLRFQAPAMRL
jgi:hypothetical protein